MREGEALDESREHAIRAELDHLLGSPAFRTSKRCREFLTYIVEHTMTGARVTLKERSIGVDLFRLPYDFDTGQHTIVRVTASEVRKKLAQHYVVENGAHHGVKIELPTGSYSAEFKWAELPVETLSPEPSSDQVQPAERQSAEPLLHAGIPRNWHGWLIFSCVAVVAIAVTLAVWRRHAVKPLPVEKVQPVINSAGGPPGVENLRMIVGSSGPYVDRNGRTWGEDRFFSGGSVQFRSSEKIFRTLDPDIYRHVRHGDFRYDIPLKPGSYELHLHFAETGLADFISAESSGEGQRVFRVAANGRILLDFFDVLADAEGANISDERIFRNISPAADGFLHLSFTSIRGTAMLSAIELLSVNPGKVESVRIRAGWPASWRDSTERQWQADAYFRGGNALVRNTNPVPEGDSSVRDPALYASERWGHFSYAVPVPDGQYKVTLKFSEGHYGKRNTGVGGLGSRVFDVYCNGVALLRDFDIFKEAGGEGRPVDRTFSGVRPTAQGKILLSFVPIVGMACVNGIEVAEDSK